jgi:peptide/nickel transport system ATP-binding protein
VALLELRDLVVRFGDDVAVDRISMSLERGETLGIVGESGCGKTVTARAIMGLLPKNASLSGSIRYDGKELVHASEELRRSVRGAEIAMIFQEPMTALNPVLTIGYQIAEGVLAHRDVSKKEARAIALEMLQKVGIAAPEQRLDEYPHQLSGGMRQRAMIAMALAMGPKVLLADEPTTALDVTVQAQILQLIARLRAEHGMAMVMITHDLTVVAESCDRMVVMYAGRIVEEGPVKRVLEAPLHPYTRGLLRSIPGAERRARLEAIPGVVPSLRMLPSGCRFHPRCARAEERCSTESPELAAESERGRKGRQADDRVSDRERAAVACFFPGEDRP